MGGLYFGFFTDIESAAVGAIGAFLCAVFRGKLNRGSFFEVMAETTATTAMVYGLIIGAQIFSFFVGASALTESATAYVSGLQWSPLAVMALILFGYLALGMVMELFAVMIITVPIITPLVLTMGYDIVWWGIIMLCVVETGMIHPPFGLNVFVLKGHDSGRFTMDDLQRRDAVRDLRPDQTGTDGRIPRDYPLAGPIHGSLTRHARFI